MQRDWRIRVSVFGQCHVLYFLRFMVLKFGFFQPVHVNNFRIMFIFVDKIANLVDKLIIDRLWLTNLSTKEKERMLSTMYAGKEQRRAGGHALLMRTPTDAA